MAVSRSCSRCSMSVGLATQAGDFPAIGMPKPGSVTRDKTWWWWMMSPIKKKCLERNSLVLTELGKYCLKSWVFDTSHYHYQFKFIHRQTECFILSYGWSRKKNFLVFFLIVFIWWTKFLFTNWSIYFFQAYYGSL